MSIKPTDYIVEIDNPDRIIPTGNGDFVLSSPQWWSNFRKFIYNEVDWSKKWCGTDEFFETIKFYLSKDDIKIKLTKKQKLILVFNCEADFLMFKLKWS